MSTTPLSAKEYFDKHKMDFRTISHSDYYIDEADFLAFASQSQQDNDRPCLRWVKAFERLPDEQGLFYCVSQKKADGETRTKPEYGWFSGKNFVFPIGHEEGWTIIEWLEEIPKSELHSEVETLKARIQKEAVEWLDSEMRQCEDAMKKYLIDGNEVELKKCGTFLAGMMHVKVNCPVLQTIHRSE